VSSGECDGVTGAGRWPRGRAKRVVQFYNGRGTAEQWIKEGEHAVHTYETETSGCQIDTA
jgi:hypothetical protein